MSNKSEQTNPVKRYKSRLLKLAAVDPEIKRLIPDKLVGERASVVELSLECAIDTILAGYSERQALGTRKYIIKKHNNNGKNVKNYLSEYSMITYGRLRSLIHALANAWRYSEKYQVNPDEFVCIIGFASVDYVILDTACAYAHTITVPMQSTTSNSDLDEVLANIKPTTIAVTVVNLAAVTQHVCSYDYIRTIIVFDYDNRDDHDLSQLKAAQTFLDAVNASIQLITLDELILFGKNYKFDFLPSHKAGINRMGAIIHSSGSAGKPKGAIFRDKANRQSWINRAKEKYPTVTVLFAPLNHRVGRALLQGTLGRGGTVYITLKADMSTLFEDIRLARPTYLSFFPRVLELIYQHYQNEVVLRVNAGEGKENIISKKVMQEMRANFLGDRLLAGTVGSAPTAKTVKDFIVECFDILFAECYSNTEAGIGAIAINGHIQRSNIVAYKLIDIPEFGCYTSDKPYPRGEFCYKSIFGITEYYQQPEATADLFDDEGFIRTGDIVEERGSDLINVIGRCKDALKLSQGEYVDLESLRNIFENDCELIKQIYLYGNSLRSYLLAVIVPEMKNATVMLGQKYSDDVLRKAIYYELQNIARQYQLKTFEVPRDFIIEYEPFSQANGLLSSLKKRLRLALQRKYGKRLEELYVAKEAKQKEEIIKLQDPKLSLSIFEKLVSLLELNLHRQNIDSIQRKTFRQLGGDSICAAQFSMHIEEVFGVTIPASVILSPTGNLQYWNQLLESELSEKNLLKPTFTSIHGKDVTTIHKSDLNLEKFLGIDVIKDVISLDKSVTKNRTVLLTGANGFLGSVVCLQYLEKLAQINGKLVCLIRAANNLEAKRRLDECFTGLEPNIYLRYQKLAVKHLEVLAGDIGNVYLGLQQAVFMRLATEVDRIIHVGAFVNHSLHYKHLFQPNVVGTAEVIRLAITTKIKTIDFVSSKTVHALTNSKLGLGENAPLIADINLDDHYGNGYAASKWAAEYLLQQAYDTFGIPVNILRSGIMLAHSTIKGMINISDIFTRLLFSIVITGLAPASFYKLQPQNNRMDNHYDGLPVDIVAAALLSVSDIVHTNYHTYNIHNYHEKDGCSLNTFVDWLESAGYKIIRIQDYNQWFEKFQQALHALPEDKKQFSAINVLSVYAHAREKENSIPCDNFRQLISCCNIGHTIPHLDEAYIHKFLKDMQLIGLIPIQ